MDISVFQFNTKVGDKIKVKCIIGYSFVLFTLLYSSINNTQQKYSKLFI